MTTPAELYGRIADHFSAGEHEEALAIASDHWPEMREREANAYDAESARLLALSAIEQTEVSFGLAELWRTRALTRFSAIGWHEGVAMYIMARAFVDLSMTNSDYADGRTLDVIAGSIEALSMFDEIELFLRMPSSGISVGERSPSKAGLERFFHEKRGFLLVVLGRLEEARESYDRAIAVATAAGNRRGIVKSRMGRALVDYLAGDTEGAARVTADGVAEASSTGHPDLVDIGTHNVAVMGRGGRDLRPYEIL
jgi:tetratricopeptide (TPR) repeat protein